MGMVNRMMTIDTTNPGRQAPGRLARSAGFSLVEILVAISLMAIMTVAVAPQLKYLVNFQSGMQTQNLLSELQSGFAAAYQANVSTIEANPSAVLSFPSVTVPGAVVQVQQALASGTGRCTATAATFAPWSDYTGHAASSLATDGYGAPLCVFISPRMAVTLNGVNLYYHVVAFVSTGPNRVLDNGTGLTAQGNLTLYGDDTGVAFNGQSFVLGQYNQTVTKMQNVAQALSAYYLMRYQADPTRSSSIDYWSNGAGSAYPSRWDLNNTPTSNQIPWETAATNMVTSTISTVLSLSQNDVTDGFGHIMQFENASSNVRSPDSGAANSPMTFPPYTALISTTLPGGSVLSQAVVGINN